MVLAAQLPVRQSWRMVDAAPENTDRLVWGHALRALRKRHGRTVNEAAQAFEPEHYSPGDPDKGVSIQRWSQIEKGRYRFTEEQRRRLAKAAGGDVEELELERARILGHRREAAPAQAFSEREPSRLAIPFWGRPELGADGWKVKAADVTESSFNLVELTAASIGAMRIADDAMKPKASPGDVVIFDRSRRPIEGRGCVVETQAGELYARIYDGEDAEHVVVSSLARPTPQAFRRAEVRGVYAVRFWGD